MTQEEIKEKVSRIPIPANYDKARIRFAALVSLFLSRGFGFEASARMAGTDRSGAQGLLLFAKKRHFLLDADFSFCSKAIYGDGEVTVQQEMSRRVAQICVSVCEYFNADIDGVKSHNRNQMLVFIRQMIYGICFECIPGISLAGLGRIFDRDHTTVLHGKSEHDKFMQNEIAYRGIYQSCLKYVQGVESRSRQQQYDECSRVVTDIFYSSDGIVQYDKDTMVSMALIECGFYDFELKFYGKNRMNINEMRIHHRNMTGVYRTYRSSTYKSAWKKWSRTK